MKKSTTFVSRTVAGMLLLLVLSVPSLADNTKTTVDQVNDEVTISNDVDYIVNSATPFGTNGKVNIANTEHAVLILNGVKPSAAIKLLSGHVTINGVQAANNVNCQVKIYNRGAIIMPYASDFKPLTVYSEQNFGGEECNDFGLENSGGFMNTLTNAKLNNRIRSFKLKRGYMVTFSNRPSGRGYSRCFIAADADLEVAELPGVLDRSISSYRVFKWYDTGKVSLAAAGGDWGACNALNVTSTYTWSTGSSMAPDIEVVPHQIYSGYPSASSVGSADFSPHLKTTNEPRNSADDHPEELDAILNNWESLMRTGLRLCTPSSWDGSDYWNGTGFLKTFLDSIDARGWRCDIVDMHCYWDEGSFGNLNNWHIGNRPIWISEWCWGASWNSNGAFASGRNENDVKNALTRICNTLNGMDYVERYFYWNGERDPSKLYKNGSLTPAGEMYSKLNSGVGYNKKYNYAPKVPTQKDPTNLTIEYDKLAQTATLKWYDYNGEMNVSMFIQRMRAGGSFEDLVEVERKEVASNYTFTVEDAQAGDQYRIQIEDANHKVRTTKAVTAVSNNLEAGDPIDMDGATKYLGGNMVVNGDFDLGFYGWTTMDGNEPCAPYFQVVPVGGVDGGSYLQSYANGSVVTPEQFIKTIFDVDSNADYYYSGSFSNGVSNGGIYLSGEGLTVETKARVFNNSSTDNTWSTNFKTFNTGDSTKVIFYFNMLKRKAQFDKQMLCKLFDTREEAIADGIAKARLKADAFQQFNKKYNFLNTELAQHVAGVTDNDAKALSAVMSHTALAQKAYATMPVVDSLVTVSNALAALQLSGATSLTEAVNKVAATTTAAEVIELRDQLSETINNYITSTLQSGVVLESKLATTNKWTVKCGTYTGGDQRTKTDLGTTFWNAWWSNIDASEGNGKTMEIKQEITNLPHGFYTLSCKAMTEHYCTSDQHAYITSGDQTAVSPVLTADYYDLAARLNMPKDNVWQKLTTTPVYVDEGGSVTIGFVGSKSGAVNNAWHEIGGKGGSNAASDSYDKREGWWCATDFQLYRAPGYKMNVTPGEFGTICLPYTIRPSEGMHYYAIAGITTDHQNLCLYEIDEVDQARPCIFKSDNATAVFSGYGNYFSFPKSHDFLQGTFKAVTRPEGYYIVSNGQWVRLDSTTGVEAYTACLKKDVVAEMAEYDSWEEYELMPISGADIDFANIILSPDATSSSLNSKLNSLHDLSGRQVESDRQLRSGLYIQVVNGKARKYIKR